MHFLDDKIEELSYLANEFSEEEHRRHGFYFRKQLWNYISISPFMARTNMKPRGYAGDSEMMRMIYLNKYQGGSTFAKLMHKHPIEHPAAQAVRSRRHFITKALIDFEKYNFISSNRNLKILSVACGPVFEMMDILLSPEDCKRYHFTLLDQDREALFEAVQVIEKIEKQLGSKINSIFLNESVRTMLGTPQLKKKWGQFHFIYSMGLFDYLTPPVATNVIGKLYQLLKPGGEMVVGNFHVSNPSKWYMEYWLDWVLYHRTEAEFINLLKDLPSAKVNVFFEDTGSQMFLHAKKPRE
jgi:extracellular factor (EF) 3-hydroxypalmitic acid methyl ester biosynthesis protein